MNGAVRSFLLVAALASGIAWSEPTRTTPQSSVPKARATIRVGMWTLWHDRQVEVNGSGAASYRTCAACAARALAHIEVQATPASGLSVINKHGAAHTESLLLAGGTLELRAHGQSQRLAYPVTITAHSGTLMLAVELPIEHYVEQVVASEADPSDSMESLKALAIVVRSYALHERHGHADYGVCDSTHCQLLRWSSPADRREAAHIAALQTAGETLWFRGKPALAYFNKDCGGHSAAVGEVWPRSVRAPYLVSQADRYCTGAGQQWAAEMTRAELTAALARRGLVAPGWQTLIVSQRAPSGRVVTLRLDGTSVAAEEFRIAVGEALGWNRIPSTWFEVSASGDRFFFHGRGWGHGVGLCQRGAARMGAQGRTADEILAQYFPGAYAADEATGARWISQQGEGFTLETTYTADRALLRDVARARAEASERSGLNSNANFAVRTFPSTAAYREETLSPGWTAGFTEGNWIAVQPLKTLVSRHLLADTMRHEFVHALVEQQAGPAAPLWLREGLVEFWAAPEQEAQRLRERTPKMSLGAVELDLRSAATQAQSAAAHHDAAAYAARALEQNGRAKVMEWLRSGVPANLPFHTAYR